MTGRLRVLVWHVHGSWMTSFVHGDHDYLRPTLPDASGGPRSDDDRRDGVMFRVALANMPFAALQRPSIALTQIKAVVDAAFPALFLALLVPQLRTQRTIEAAVLGAGIALAPTPFTPAGVPIRVSVVTEPAAGRITVDLRDNRTTASTHHGVGVMAQRLTVSRLANLAAHGIYDAFDRYQTEFSRLTRRASEHFESRAWEQLQADTAARIHLYGVTVNDVVAHVRELLTSSRQVREPPAHFLLPKAPTGALWG